MRFYAGGYNLITFSKTSHLIDPEANHLATNQKASTSRARKNGVGIYYPITGTYNFGVEVNF